MLEADWTTIDVTYTGVDAAAETVVGGMVVEGVATIIGVVETGADGLGGVKVENDVVVSIIVVGPMTEGGVDEVIGSVVTGVKLVTADAVATQDQHIKKPIRERARTRNVGHSSIEGKYMARRCDEAGGTMPSLAALNVNSRWWKLQGEARREWTTATQCVVSNCLDGEAAYEGEVGEQFLLVVGGVFSWVLVRPEFQLPNSPPILAIL